MIKITINIYVYVIECPYTQLLLEKNTYIIQSQNKTKFNQCTNATKKRYNFYSTLVFWSTMINDASMNLRRLFEFITWPIFISQNMRDWNRWIKKTILQLHDGKENVFKCIFKEITGPRKICIPRYSTCIYRKLLQLVMHVWSGSRRENWYVYARPENNSTFPFSAFNHIVSLKVHSFLLKRNKTCGIHAKILLMHEFFLQL